MLEQFYFSQVNEWFNIASDINKYQDNIKKIMARLTKDESLLAGFIIPKLYETLLTPQDKKEWKKQFSIHHGEAGVLAFVVGVLGKMPRLAAFGLGLAADDWKDRNKWFH